MEKVENINQIKEIITKNKGLFILNWKSRNFNDEIPNYISEVKGLVVKVSTIPTVILQPSALMKNVASMDKSEFKKMLLLGFNTSYINPSKLNTETKNHLIKIIFDSLNIQDKYFSSIFFILYKGGGLMGRNLNS